MSRSVFLASFLVSGCVTAEPTAPASSEESTANALAAMTRTGCGATWSLRQGDRAGSGVYVIGVFPEAGVGEVQKTFPDQAALAGFIRRHAALLAQPGNNVGTYCETEHGDCHAPGPVTCYLDVAREAQSLDEAARLAKACNQKSIARLDAKGVEIIDQAAGKPFGDGKPLAGPALDSCRKARGG